MKETIEDSLKNYDFIFFPIYPKALMWDSALSSSLGIVFISRYVAECINSDAQRGQTGYKGRSVEFCFSYTPNADITNDTLDEIHFEMINKSLKSSNPQVCVFLSKLICQNFFEGFDYPFKSLWLFVENVETNTPYELFVNEEGKPRVRPICFKKIFNLN